MDSIDILQIFLTIAPSIIVGLVAYYFFNTYMKNEEGRRRYALRKETAKDSLPHRLQALERMTLFLERIDPGSLLVRIKPSNGNKHDYENMLIATIEKEFEHNLTQQVYVSPKCWNAIRATKNATISLIRKSNMSDKVDSPHKLREVILTELLDKEAPSDTGLAYIKKEARTMW